MRNAPFALLLVLGGCGRAPVDATSVEARLDAVRAAIKLSIEGAQEFTPHFPPAVLGDGLRFGPRVTWIGMELRAFDWSGVDFSRFEGGPVGALVAQAQVWEQALAAVGLVPVRTSGASRGRVSEIPFARAHGVRVGGGGGGGCLLDLDAPRLVHYRVYRGSKSGATLFIRQEYDQALRRLEVEFSYSDTTILGQDYPEARDVVEETVNVE
jgi:hypothetical protein